MLKLMQLNIQLFAHKKGQGSTKNGRDSISKRLGAKAADGEFVTGGSILYRQRGTKVYPGTNVGIGSDDTVYAKIDGYVKFERVGKDRKQVAFTLLSNLSFFVHDLQTFAKSIYFFKKCDIIKQR